MMQSRRFGTGLFAFVATLAVAGLATGYSANTASQSAERGDRKGGPKVIAAYFHADWCGYCKELGPRFSDLKAKYDTEPVLYVKFDQTREADRRQARYLAHALGLSDLWEDHGGSTGFIAYIDAEKHEKLVRVDHTEGLGPIGDELEKCIAHVKGDRR